MVHELQEQELLSRMTPEHQVVYRRLIIKLRADAPTPDDLAEGIRLMYCYGDGDGDQQCPNRVWDVLQQWAFNRLVRTQKPSTLGDECKEWQRRFDLLAQEARDSPTKVLPEGRYEAEIAAWHESIRKARHGD